MGAQNEPRGPPWLRHGTPKTDIRLPKTGVSFFSVLTRVDLGAFCVILLQDIKTSRKKTQSLR